MIILLIFQQAILADETDYAHAAVSLLFFRGQHDGDSVLLQWATATELDTAYFYLERSMEESGAYQTLDQIGIVPSEAPPDGLSGAEYERRDDDALVTDRTYWYVLVEVEIGLGSENRTEPIRVAVSDGQPTSTGTPTAAAGSQLPTATATQATVSTSLTPTSTTTAGQATASSGATALAGVAQTPTISTQAATDGPLANAALTTSALDTAGALRARAQVTAEASAYPGPDEGALNNASASGSAGYPAAPPTPKVFATNSYPVLTRTNEVIKGTPVPNVGSRIESLGNQATDVTESANNSPALGTLFLWLGFAAALVVFVSAVAGAIYFYSRQRTGSN